MAFLRTRSFPLFALAVLGALPLIRVVQDGGPVLSVVGMLVALVIVGILPGTLLSIALGAASSGALLEAIAIGFGASFAVVQLLTLIAIQFQISAPMMLIGLWGGCGVIAAAFLIWPPRVPWSIGTQQGLWIVMGLAIALAACLYVQTPFEPWMTGEDAIHVAVVQRLTYEPAPMLNTIYWAPNFVYTYPFPGTHYFIALVSRAADLDPIFAYQKTRLFWGPMTLLILYASARLVFRSERMAFASAAAAAVLTFTGAFGPISSTWGQLAVVSHASDVAMTTVLPSLLLFALSFAAATTWRSAALFLMGTLALALTLTVVHIREVVQFLVYCGAAWLVYRFIVRDRRLASRFWVMAVATVVLVVVYLKWYQLAVGHVDSVVGQRRAKLIQDVAGMSWLEMLTPIFLNGYFTINHEYFYYMWFPFILLLGAVLLFRHRAEPLVPFFTASLLAYAIIVFVPFVAIIYVYLTYYEILFTPVRNSLFFIYLLAGPIILMAADALARLAPRRGAVAGVLGAVALWIAYGLFAAFFRRSQNMIIQNIFFLTLIGLLAAALLPWRRLAAVGERWRAADESAPAPRGGLLPFYAVLTVVAVIGFSWKNSPMNFAFDTSKWTMGQYLAGMPDIRSDAFSTFRDPITDQELRLSEPVRFMAPPSPELIDFGRRALPTNAVMVHNLFNTYASPVFMPQHILMWPVDTAAGLEFNARLFPQAWAGLVATAETHQAQPFFNEKESIEERAAYMTRVGATHVLIDPMYYARLRPFFEQWQSRFEPVFDDGQRWAVLTFRGPR